MLVKHPNKKMINPASMGLTLLSLPLLSSALKIRDKGSHDLAHIYISEPEPRSAIAGYGSFSRNKFSTNLLSFH